MESNETHIRQKLKPEVIVTNEPAQSPHEIDENFNKMRKEFIPHIRQFVAEHEQFRGEERVSIAFAQKGISSIIAIIETPNKKLVLKIPRSATLSGGEAEFFKVWEREGVAVPHVFETGVLHGAPYSLMEYIDAPILGDAYTHEELIKNGTYRELGRTLRSMHRPKAEGYGSVVDGRAEFKTIDAWLASDDMKTRFDYVQKHKLLGPIADLLPSAVEKVRLHAQQEGSSYCHTDFKEYNMFATEPVTIFDANPKFHNRYYDLGLLKLREIADHGQDKGARSLLDAYFAEETCDEEVLRAYTLLALVIKLPYWHKTKREKQIQNTLRYFSGHPTDVV